MSATDPNSLSDRYILLFKRANKKLLNPVLTMALIGVAYLLVSDSLKRGTFTEDAKAAMPVLLALGVLVFVGRMFRQELLKWQTRGYFHRFILEFGLILLSISAYHLWQFSHHRPDQSWSGMGIVDDVATAGLTALFVSFFGKDTDVEKPAENQELQLPQRDEPIA